MAAPGPWPDDDPLDAPTEGDPGSGRLARLGRTVAGWLLVVVGVLLIPLPGPGWAIVAAGVALLAKDHPWAARLLAGGKDRLLALKARFRRSPRG